jgi:hypothetical protein
MNLPVPVGRIEQSSHIIQGYQVMLDTDMAELLWW